MISHDNTYVPGTQAEVGTVGSAMDKIYMRMEMDKTCGCTWNTDGKAEACWVGKFQWTIDMTKWK